MPEPSRCSPHRKANRLPQVPERAAAVEDKRALIRSAAVRAFAKKGYHACRVSDIAVEAGAKFVVVVNPLVPFVNDFEQQIPTLTGPRARRVSDMGFPQIGYQAFKLLAYQRLHEMTQRWEERYPGVDIILIEPEPNDELMFQTSILNYASRVEIARHGFQSVTLRLAHEYARYKRICARHGSIPRLVSCPRLNGGVCNEFRTSVMPPSSRTTAVGP